MRLRPWAEEMCFTIRDRIVKAEDGTFVAQVEPEDWAMSRWWNARGLKVMATSKIGTLHHGAVEFASFPCDHGDETDPMATGALNPPLAAIQ